jgi:hypothetical protein
MRAVAAAVQDAMANAHASGHIGVFVMLVDRRPLAPDQLRTLSGRANLSEEEVILALINYVDDNKIAFERSIMVPPSKTRAGQDD